MQSSKLEQLTATKLKDPVNIEETSNADDEEEDEEGVEWDFEYYHDEDENDKRDLLPHKPHLIFLASPVIVTK